MTFRFLDRAQMTVSGTPGTGAITLSAATTNNQSFSAAGMTNGDTTRYLVTDGANWEIGLGTYSTSGTLLTRTTVLQTSAGGTSPIALSSSAIVSGTLSAEDLTSSWLNLTFSGSAGSYFGNSNCYVSDQTLTVAVGDTIEVEVWQYMAAGSNVYSVVSADGSTGYEWGTNSSGVPLIAQAGVTGIWSGNGSSFTGKHHTRWVFEVNATNSVSMHGTVDDVVGSSFTNTGVDLVGNVAVYMMTTDLTKCAARIRKVTAANAFAA